jgi:hypothetical protein
MESVKRWSASLAILSATLLLFAGCGSKEAAVYPVKGKVQWKGGGPATELVDYGISLEPPGRKDSGMGTIMADGSFTISTFAENDGAVPGKHRVAISPPAPELDKPAPKSKINKRYSDFETSGLQLEVKSEPNDLVIELER